MKNQNDLDKHLDRLIRKSENQVTKIYAARYKEITKEIDKMYKNYEVGGKLTLNEMNRYNRLDKSLDSITRELLKGQNQACRLAQRTAEQQYLENYYRSAHMYEFTAQRKLGFGLVDNDTIKAAVENPIDKLKLPAVKSRNRKAVVDRIRNDIAQGLARGSSYREMTTIVRKAVDMDMNKARTVVQTESHRAQVKGRDASARQAEKYVKLEKKWSAALDGSTRSAHQDLDGVTIGMDEDFKSPNGGVGPYPSSLNSASDDIRCRCSCLYLVNGREPELRRARTETGDNEVIPYVNYKDWEKERLKK
ncbi:phage minor head protein [Virgibacillus sp. C22-A2]|uniref:Phage minor head protein n=1 Tax=Virgibacillus tibetensis TaxID=3042313 RepID=A0ABU6KC64_9BACI|nr:phage minor head protein [Virgibacillus sp. C22-A2]